MQPSYRIVFSGKKKKICSGLTYLFLRLLISVPLPLRPGTRFSAGSLPVPPGIPLVSCAPLLVRPSSMLLQEIFSFMKRIFYTDRTVPAFHSFRLYFINIRIMRRIPIFRTQFCTNHSSCTAAVADSLQISPKTETGNSDQCQQYDSGFHMVFSPCSASQKAFLAFHVIPISESF